MPIAAVPTYLPKNSHEKATPADRFGLLLPIWTNRQDQEKEVRKRADKRSWEAREVKKLLDISMDYAIQTLTSAQRNPLPELWKKNDDGAKGSWKEVIKLTTSDQSRMAGLAERHTALAYTQTPDSVLQISSKASAPFSTGLGNAHPLENGFAFLMPYGLPYLPGSGVKGVVRRAATELAEGQWGSDKGWVRKPEYEVSTTKGENIELTAIDVLFGLESEKEETQHFRGALNFWDVVPQLAGDTMAVEIMTPHQSHYIQGDKPESPHESGQPIPLFFLSVPAESTFSFIVSCDLPRLQKIAPALAHNGHWRTLLTAAFEHAFQWVGFGAKTAVGYGAMERDLQGEQDKRNAQKKAAEQREEEKKIEQEALERQAFLNTLDPIDKEIQNYLDARPNKSQGEGSALVSAISAGEFNDRFTHQELAKKAKDMLQKEGIWKETSARRNPDKDKLHQRTLTVMAWLKSNHG